MNLNAIAQLIEDAGLGRQAETIFVNQMPAPIKRGILLKNRLNGSPINHELPGYIKTSFQAIVRAVTLEDANGLATELSVGLTMLNAQVDDMNVRYLRPRHLPIAFPPTASGQMEVAVNFDICFSVPQ